MGIKELKQEKVKINLKHPEVIGIKWVKVNLCPAANCRSETPGVDRSPRKAWILIPSVKMRGT